MRVIVRSLIGTHVDRLVVERHVIGESIVVVLVIAAGVILVDENLDAVVVPVLHQRVAVAVEQDVVHDFHEDVQTPLVPCDLEAPAEIFRGILGPQPQAIDRIPLGGLPDRFPGDAIDDRRIRRARREVAVATLGVRRVCKGRHAGNPQQAGAEQSSENRRRAGHCNVPAAVLLWQDSGPSGPCRDERASSGLPGRLPEIRPIEAPKLSSGTEENVFTDRFSLPRNCLTNPCKSAS